MTFEDDIRKSLDSLRKGEVILYPTDTIWGLGCDATNSSAVEKIYLIKSRSSLKSLIILVDGMPMLERYVMEVPPIAYELTDVTDTPLTLIYPKGKNLAEGVCAEDGSVAIRICQDDFCSTLVSRFRKPIVSTSANLSGSPAPATFADIDPEIIRSAGYVVSHRREDTVQKPASPVIKVALNGTIRIIRK